MKSSKVGVCFGANTRDLLNLNVKTWESMEKMILDEGRGNKNRQGNRSKWWRRKEVIGQNKVDSIRGKLIEKIMNRVRSVIICWRGRIQLVGSSGRSHTRRRKVNKFDGPVQNELLSGRKTFTKGSESTIPYPADIQQKPFTV